MKVQQNRCLTLLLEALLVSSMSKWKFDRNCFFLNRSKFVKYRETKQKRFRLKSFQHHFYTFAFVSIKWNLCSKWIPDSIIRAKSQFKNHDAIRVTTNKVKQSKKLLKDYKCEKKKPKCQLLQYHAGVLNKDMTLSSKQFSFVGT